MRPQRILVFLTLVFALAQAAPASAQVARVEPLSIDFGPMKQNEVREAQVTVSNAGGGILVIREVRPDCGCTVAELKKKKLAPGEKTVLDLTFDSKKFFGPVRKVVHLFTNDPDNPTVDVMLEAVVDAPLEVLPTGRRLRFHNTMLGETRTMEVNFKATQVPKLELSATGTEKGHFDFEIISNLDDDPRQAKVLITLPEEFPVGRILDNLRVTTNVPEDPYVDVKLVATVGRALVSHPETVNFRFKKKFRQEVRIRPFYNGELAFNVTKIESDLPGISAEIVGGKQNFEVVIELTGRPIPSTDPRAVETEGRIKGILKVHTDHKDVPVIEVPVSYMVRM